MSSKRRSSQTQNTMNFRPGGSESFRSDVKPKGTRPTAKPSSIKEVLVMALLHICKKSIFFDINLKVALYLGSLFILSVIGDFVPFPKTYFSRSDNFFNVYFVKISWFWTLLLSIPFLFITSCITCCGDFKKVIRNHLPRLLIATIFWYFWTKSFNLIESTYGRCNSKNLLTKSSCLRAGFLWSGFDISGHAFILIYSSLIMIEEAKPIISWDSIKEHIRNEMYNRSVSESSTGNPLRKLNDEEIKTIKNLYERYTPAIRVLFIAMTALQLLWDVMLITTMLYYHRMIEKVIGGIIAVLTWFVTYKFWYQTSYLPDPPGFGSFIYQKDNKQTNTNQTNVNRGSSSKFTAKPTTRNNMQRPNYKFDDINPNATDSDDTKQANATFTEANRGSTTSKFTGRPPTRSYMQRTNYTRFDDINFNTTDS